MKVDLSEMMGMLMMFSGMGESEESETEDLATMQMDTLVRFADMPDSISQSWKHPDITSRAIVSMRMSGPDQEMWFNISMPFKKITEVDLFSEDMASGLGALGGPMEADRSDAAMFFPTAGKKQFEFKPGSFSRLKVPFDMGSEMVDSEELEMMKMMLGSSSYTVEYVFPGQVKKVSNSDYETDEDGKTVRATYNFLDLLDGKDDLGVDITYK